MNRFTRRLVDFFNKENVTYYMDEKDDPGNEDSLVIPALLKSIPGLVIRVYISEKGKCSFMTKMCTAEDDEMVKKLYPVINKLNSQYSFVTFCIDERNSVYMNLSFMLSSHMSYVMIDEYFGAVISIGGSAVKEILPIVWGMHLVEDEEEIEYGDEDVEYDDFDEFDDYYQCDEYIDPDEENNSEPISEEDTSLNIDGQDFFGLFTDEAEEVGNEDKVELEADEDFKDLFSDDGSDDSDADDNPCDEESAAS